jgi:hypothetical protein
VPFAIFSFYSSSSLFFVHTGPPVGLAAHLAKWLARHLTTLPKKH